MKKFKFELEQVLEIREFERQQAEGELSKCIAVENEIGPRATRMGTGLS